MQYALRVLIALDQLLATVIFSAQPDETISAMAHRRGWKRLEVGINWLFRDQDHCRKAYIAERDRHHLPQEYKQ